MPARLDRFLTRAALAVAALLPATASAYNLSGERWTGTTITMQLQLGSSGGTLLDGSTSWDASAEDALAQWNNSLTRIKFSVVRNSTAATGYNSVNNVLYSSTVYGDAWGSRVLAVTLSRTTSNSAYIEGDVLFNRNLSWNSYTGPQRTSGGAALYDFHRVALHEFGHVLGLGHPDDIGQRVTAVMNSTASDLDVLTADDIAGARAIYDSVTVAPSSLLTLQGSFGYTQSGSSLNLRAGRVQNEGNATSGTVQLELWAMPQHYDNGLPTGSRRLGAYTFTSVLAPGFGFPNVNVNTTYTAPPNGVYYVAMLVTEFTGASSGSGYTIRDYGEFDSQLVVGNSNSPAITSQPFAQTVNAGASVTFSAAASGAATLRYQWFKDGTAIAGATSATLTLTSVQPASAGDYTVTVTNNSGSVTSTAARLTVNFSRLANLSVRTLAGSGSQTLIVGFALGTGTSKPVLIRALGPALIPFGVSGTLADPTLTLQSGSTTLQTNNNWNDTQTLASTFLLTGAFALPVGSKDAALSRTLSAGTYSALVSGTGSGTGVSLVELYDADPNPPASTAARLVNASARAQVNTGDDVLIVGFAISGNTPKSVLIRAVGPSLTAYGVTGALANPRLDLFSGDTIIQSNDDWGGTTALRTAFTSVAAFDLASSTSRDSALVATLPPGNYSAKVSGVSNGTGVALMEIYELP